MEDNLTKINAEGGELVISNGLDVAIIPKKWALEVKDMLKEKCFKCLDALVSELPKDAQTAQEGTVVSEPISEALLARLAYYNDLDEKMRAATDLDEKETLSNIRSKSRREDLLHPDTKIGAIKHKIIQGPDQIPFLVLDPTELNKLQTALKQKEEAKLLAENKAALEEDKAIKQNEPEVKVTEAVVVQNDEPVVSAKSVEVTKPDLEKGQRRVAIPGFGINKIIEEKNGKVVTLFWENRAGLRIDGKLPTNKTFQYAKTFEELTKDPLYESILKK